MDGQPAGLIDDTYLNFDHQVEWEGFSGPKPSPQVRAFIRAFSEWGIFVLPQRNPSMNALEKISSAEESIGQSGDKTVMLADGRKLSAEGLAEVRKWYNDCRYSLEYGCLAEMVSLLPAPTHAPIHLLFLGRMGGRRWEGYDSIIFAGEVDPGEYAALATSVMWGLWRSLESKGMTHG